MLQKKASVVLKNNPMPSLVVFCSLTVFNIFLLKVWEERWLFFSLTWAYMTYWNHSLTMCCLFLSQVSSLVLYVEEAHKLPVKYFNSPYCNIYLNSVQVAKTHHREGQNPVFTEEFIFEWVCLDHFFSICHSSFSLSILSSYHIFSTCLQNNKMYLSVVSVTCQVKSTDLKSA